MVTAALPGFTAVLYIADDGCTLAKVGEVRELTLDVEQEVIDATSHDSAGWREFIKGLRNWTITGGLLHLTSDAAQMDIRAAILAGTLMDLELREDEGAPNPVWTGSAFVSAMSLSFPNDDAMTGDITLQGTAAIVESDQS